MQSDRSNALFRNQRLIAILVVVLFSATVIPFAEANAATLDRIKQAGKILLGYRSDARPFSYEDSGKADGYAAAICQAAADKLKSELGISDLAVEWVPVTIDNQFQAVQEGKVDILCGAAETLSARKSVDFSVPIFVGGVGALDVLGLRRDGGIALRGGRRRLSFPDLNCKPRHPKDGDEHESGLALQPFRLSTHARENSPY